MKKWMIILLLLLVPAAGCDKEPAEEPQTEPEQEQTEPVQDTQDVEQPQTQPEQERQVYTEGMLYGSRISPDAIAALTAEEDYGTLSPFDVDGAKGLVTKDGCVVLDAVCSEIYRAICYSADYSWSIDLDVYVMVKKEAGANRYAVCALDGSWVTDFVYEDVISCNDGVLCIRDGNKNLAEYINEKGEEVFSTENFECLADMTPYNSAYLSQWSDGYCPVDFGDEGFKFINTEGTVCSGSYQQAMGFSDGVAAVQENDLWGYIDTDFNWVLEPQFLSALSSCARTAIALGQDYMYYVISPSGEILGSFELNSMYFGSQGEYIIGWDHGGEIYYGSDLNPVTIDSQPVKSCGPLYYIQTENGVKVLNDRTVFEIPGAQELISGSTVNMLCVTVDDEFSAIVDRNGNELIRFSNCNMYVVPDSVTGKSYVVVEDMVSRRMDMYDGQGALVASDVISRDTGPVNGLVQCRDDSAQGCKDLENQWVMAME